MLTDSEYIDKGIEDQVYRNIQAMLSSHRRPQLCSKKNFIDVEDVSSSEIMGLVFTTCPHFTGFTILNFLEINNHFAVG